MILKKWMQVVLLGAVALSVASCSSFHKKGQVGKSGDEAAITDANQAYSDNARASGLGYDASFSSEDGGARALSKRTYYFAFDSNVVRNSDKAAIKANADYLLTHPKAVGLLEGHTDPRGSREYNIGLGERRAKAVAEILIAKGVSPSQLRIVSYGAEKLAALGHNEAAYQKDRRVYIDYIKS